MIRVSKVNFPWVFEAMLEIELDNGAYHVNRIAGRNVIDLEGFDVPDTFEHLIEPADAGLARLNAHSEEEWDTFLCGDEDDANSIRERQGDLTEAHNLLNAWFNGWEK